MSHWRVRDDVVDEARRGLRHVPRTVRSADAAPLAAERQQLVVAALAASPPQEAMGQDAAFEASVELVLDEPRQLRAGAGLGVGDEAGRMLSQRGAI
jgi:hypothetical protein